VFVGTGPGWLYTLASSLGRGIGWPLLIICLAAVICAAVRRRPEDLVILAFALPYYAVISLSAVRFARYCLPLFPPLAILAGVGATTLWQTLSPRRSARFALAACLTLAAAYTLAYAAALDGLFVQQDPRDRAATWAASYLAPGTRIALPTVPWFYSPPLSPGFGNLRRSERLESIKQSRYKLVVDGSRDWNAALLRAARPEYIIVSDYEETDAIRANAPGAREYMRVVREHYEPAAVFESKLLGSLFGPTTALPHDMRYPAPRIVVYRWRG